MLGIPRCAVCLLIQEQEVEVVLFISLLCFSTFHSDIRYSGADEEKVDFCENEHEEDDTTSPDVDDGLTRSDFETIQLQEDS